MACPRLDIVHQKRLGLNLHLKVAKAAGSSSVRFGKLNIVVIPVVLVKIGIQNAAESQVIDVFSVI